MIVLDTDHVTVLRYTDHPKCATLRARLESSSDQHLVTTVISVEEQMRGWLAQINRRKDVHDQVPVYDRLMSLFAFFRQWEIMPFDDGAADEFASLRKQRIRLGTLDLKIASITLVHGGLLLSANLRDFRRVPGLRMESWLEPESESSIDNPQAE
jgi:tRNA(fMet)-specific endonuclease VapC